VVLPGWTIWMPYKNLLLGSEYAHALLSCSNVNDIKTKGNEASILAFLNIKAKRTWLIPKILKIEAKRTLLIQELTKIEAKRPQLIPDIRKIEAKRTLPRSPGIDSKELIMPAYALAGRSPYL
jgi:hypothetical protein